MRSAAWNEIEYLGTVEGASAADPKLIREMWERLDALRRFDQNFSAADWQPHQNSPAWRSDLPKKAS
jgi:hypothetical protein